MTKKKTTKPKKKATPAAANAGVPHTLHGQDAFESRPWKDPKAVKARFAENHKLAKVYAALGNKGSAPKTLLDLAAEAFPTTKRAQAYSWTRNQMRYLRDAKLAKRTGPGLYQKVG